MGRALVSMIFSSRWARGLAWMVRAVFAVPLQIGVIRLGVVLAHRDAPGTMSSAALADLLVFASAATGALLGPLTDGPEPRWASVETSGYRAEVHQATGMISAQLDVTQAVALSRLRAHAFSHHRPVADVAADVVALRMRFDDNDE
jgi:hypothetical protein